MMTPFSFMFSSSASLPPDLVANFLFPARLGDIFWHLFFNARPPFLGDSVLEKQLALARIPPCSRTFPIFWLYVMFAPFPPPLSAPPHFLFSFSLAR